MAANKKTFEVDRFLTRSLLLRNPDNTAPSANLALLTDGQGGTYYTYLASSGTNTAAFNQINLLDTTSTIRADLSYNILNFRQGPGIVIQKQNANTISFKASPIVPSTFFQVETPGGFVYAENMSANLKFVDDYGITFDVSDNILYMAGYPSFSAVDVYTSSGRYSTIQAAQDFSSIQFAAGFGIKIGLSSQNIIEIATSFSSFSLNAIKTPDALVTRFPSTYNELNMQQAGNINITQQDLQTIKFTSYSFANISTPTSSISARNSNSALQFKQGWGIGYSITSDLGLKLDLNVTSTFNVVSTYKGIISTPFSTNTLTIRNGYGIDLDIDRQNLTLKLASTYMRTISTEVGSVTADQNSIINFRQGDGISYSTINNSLYITATAFNQVDVSGGASIYPINPFTGVINKTIKMNPGIGMTITADQYTNTLTFQNLSSMPFQGPKYAYSYITLYSTCAYINQDISAFANYTLNAALMSEATLSLVGVQPFKVVPYADTSQRLVYFGIDQSTLFYDINRKLSTLTSTLSTVTKHIFDDYEIVFSSISTQYGFINEMDISTLNITGDQTLFRDIEDDNTMMTIFKVSTTYAEIGTLNVSTIGESIFSSALMVFDYEGACVGINIPEDETPQQDLEVRGTILAEVYATYSDKSLKKFKTPYRVTLEDLEVLRPWKFDWLNTGVEDIGFSADDVEQVVPWVVKKGANGLKMVDYSRLSVVSLAALKETNNRLTCIESTLEGIQTKLS